MQATIPLLTRSSLHRLFKRHDISRLPQTGGDRQKKKFKSYPIGYFHLDYAELARKNLSDLGLSNFEIVVGKFEDTLQPTLEKHQPIDLVFNDGHHDGKAMLAYFEQGLP